MALSMSAVQNGIGTNVPGQRPYVDSDFEVQCGGCGTVSNLGTIGYKSAGDVATYVCPVDNKVLARTRADFTADVPYGLTMNIPKETI